MNHLIMGGGAICYKISNDPGVESASGSIISFFFKTQAAFTIWQVETTVPGVCCIFYGVGCDNKSRLLFWVG